MHGVTMKAEFWFPFPYISQIR